MKATLRAYYQLTKPGIVYSNAFAALAGYLFASQWRINIAQLAATIIGVVFIIASACVANNILDQKIDTRMKRTKKRAIAQGVIAKKHAAIYAATLGIIGFSAISLTNAVTLILGVIAYGMYVVVYGYFKRASVHGTLVGSVSGALPPVAGYTAAAGQLDVAALLLFVILVGWQMPHFYAIAMFRRDDYEAAKIPVLPVVKGMKIARIQIISYITALLVVGPTMTLFGYSGVTFAVLMSCMAGAWLFLGLRYYNLADTLWARRMFFYSLGSLFVICFAIATGSIFI